MPPRARYAGTMAPAGTPRFQKPATSSESAAQLYSWGARALYLGPALGLSPHRNAVGALAVGLDGPFGVTAAPEDPSAGYRSCRTVLIPPNTFHHLADTTGRMAFLFVDPRGRELERLATLATARTDRVGFDLSIERDLIEVLSALAGGTTEWREARRILGELLTEMPRRVIDPRVKRTLNRLHADPAGRPSLADLAREVRLSESRLLHLFKAATGVPLRHYKLWLAMGAAMRAVARGQSLTTTALDAGFSSSAHFSATFREMFGLEPSCLARGRLIAEPTHCERRTYSKS